MDNKPNQEQQFLTFDLGQDLYAVSILCIKEIIEHSQLTQVPMMPPFVCGVINLRGRVVPVIDLLTRFSNGRTANGRRTCTVILEVEEDGSRQEVGILVNAVNEVIAIPAATIEPAPAFGARIRPDFIRGIGKVNGYFVIILDINQVLSMENMARVPNDDAGHALRAHEDA